MLQNNTIKKLYIKTYGCQMNVYDSIKMEEMLEPFNFTKTDDMHDADMIILNTCHIREKASEKIYSEIGRIKKIDDAKQKQAKQNNDKYNKIILVVAGCVGQAEGDEIFKRAPFVDIVVGPQSYHNLPKLLADLVRSDKKLIELDFSLEAKFDLLPQETKDQGASAFVSVQEGCDKFCTFCVVPYTRGAEFSRNVEQIYRESMDLANRGAKEIYLLGQNVNAYHGKISNQEEEYNLAQLIEHLSTIDNIKRIRYTTSHPNDMSDDLIKAHGTIDKLMPFLHLPIQSGSDKILKSMNRKHTRDDYFAIIDKLRVARPDIVLSSDFIVGFPGETDEDFADTIDLVKKIQYGQCYSFKYSPRPGTPAAVKEQVKEEAKNERLQILQKILKEQQSNLNHNTTGKILPILFEKSGNNKNQYIGKTPYMQATFIETNMIDTKDIIGKILNVKIIEAMENSLKGELII